MIQHKNAAFFHYPPLSQLINQVTNYTVIIKNSNLSSTIKDPNNILYMLSNLSCVILLVSCLYYMCVVLSCQPECRSLLVPDWSLSNFIDLCTVLFYRFRYSYRRSLGNLLLRQKCLNLSAMTSQRGRWFDVHQTANDVSRIERVSLLGA